MSSQRDDRPASAARTPDLAVWWTVKTSRRGSGMEVASGHGSTPEEAWKSMIEGKAHELNAHHDKVEGTARDLDALERLELRRGTA